MNKNIIIIVFISSVILGCGTRESLAPVSDISKHRYQHNNYHLVRKGETLYAIAWRYDMDYRELAKLNHIKAPYILHQNQKIYLKSRDKAFKKSIKRFIKIANSKDASIQKKHWIMPTSGTIIKAYNIKRGSKGIDIKASFKAPILAVQEGVIAYSGNGLPGYGNLIIVKHNQSFLSAYAYNNRNLVKEGQKVKAGQKIADVGFNKKGIPVLHFEIRRNGKPIDPLLYIHPH